MKTRLVLLSIFGLFFANAQTLNFKHLSDMSVRRGAVTSAIAGDNIYVSNGYKDSDGNATIVEKYSIKDNRWSIINSHRCRTILSCGFCIKTTRCRRFVIRDFPNAGVNV